MAETWIKSTVSNRLELEDGGKNWAFSGVFSIIGISTSFEFLKSE